MTKSNITPEEVFELMCKTASIIPEDCIDLIPSTTLAEHFQVSPYKIRKCLQELIDKGLVESGCEAGYNDADDSHRIVRGYRVTEKGRQTEEYKKAEAAAAEMINDLFSQKGEPWSER